MTNINIGIIGGGYMGKAHSIAMAAVGAVFETNLRPVLHSICGSTLESSKRYAQSFGFQNAAENWGVLVNDPDVEAVIIASPQTTHREICEVAFGLGKPVLCEKPLGASLEDANAMAKAAAVSGAVNMVGFNYIRTPVTQHALNMVHDGVLGDIVSFRAEHTEDFLSDPNSPGNWRTLGRANGNMGDLAPHIINHALAFMGPMKEVMADISTAFENRPGPGGPIAATNDDQATILCHFENGVRGALYSSRVSTGKKMGIEYEISGTKGALKFDQEDQNSLLYYNVEDAEPERGFRRILAGPAHPDYLNFCQGPAHGTGFTDQVTMAAAAFLHAIETGEPVTPSFQDGLAVSQVVDAAWRSHETRRWTDVQSSSL